MLEWASPVWFIALPLALLAPWLVRRPRVAFSALAAMRGGRSLRVWLAWVPNALASVALCLLVVAMARPQQVDRQRVVESEGIDILLLLDTSGSMEADDYELGGRSASRLAVAKQTLARFVEGRADDRLGLVVFGEDAFTQVPLTLDHAALVGFLDQVELGMAGQRATAIGDAIAVAGKRLKDLDAPAKVMILLTDGRSNSGQVAPMEAAHAAAALGIRVYTVGVGSAGGGGGGFFGMFSRRSSDLDEATLKAIAEVTGAQYFRATDSEGLEKVYATIDALETSTAEVQEFVHTEELYRGWVWAGLLCLLMQFLLGETWLRRLP